MIEIELKFIIKIERLFYIYVETTETTLKTYVIVVKLNYLKLSKHFVR